MKDTTITLLEKAGSVPGSSHALFPRRFFIAVYTKDREPFFGKQQKETVALNKFGKIAQEEWHNITHISKDIHLEKFVLLPEKLLAVLSLKQETGTNGENDPALHWFYKSKIYNDLAAFALPSIVRGYKAAVATRINMLKGTMFEQVWQNGYYKQPVHNREILDIVDSYIASFTTLA